MLGKKEMGDYQTPIFFANEVCQYLKDSLNLNPDAILEPTCGKGNFIESCSIFSPKKIVGIELNSKYADECKTKFKESDFISIMNENIFDFKTSSLFDSPKQLLVLGNPPWVTNTTLSFLESKNIPHKSNFKGMNGFEALTGASNFDISEYIILSLVEEYKNTDVFFSLISKTSVARNIYAELKKKNISFDFFEILEIDAKKIFNVSTSACVMVFKLSSKKNRSENLIVKNFDSPYVVVSQYKYENHKFLLPENNAHSDFEGICCFEWRQGVKHDCSKIMEFDCKENHLLNGENKIVNVENELLYPFMKSSMFKQAIKTEYSKNVMITQTKINQDTSYIKDKYPKSWKYLNENAIFFDKRKSSIYSHCPKFSIFGIGDYSFSKYKVGISGFYKKPFFSLLYTETKPVMLDDTSYFIGFDTFDEAYTAMLLLNTTEVSDFLESISFKDSKRPYTKKLLSRLDFGKMINSVDFCELQRTEKKLGLSKKINPEKYNTFKKLIPLELGLF